MEAEDFPTWTKTFCALIEDKGDISIHIIQCNEFIEQILTTSELDPPNTEKTAEFLEQSIPKIIKNVVKVRYIRNEYQELYKSVITNLISLYSWVFTSDYFPLYDTFIPLFDEDKTIYQENNGGQKPSAFWQEVTNQFVELASLQIMVSRFLDDGITPHHFFCCLKVLFSLLPKLDAQISIELSQQLSDSFAQYLNEDDFSNHDEDEMDYLIESLSILLSIMKLVSDQSIVQQHFSSYFRLIKYFLDNLNEEDHLDIGISIALPFFKFNDPEISKQLRDYIIESEVINHFDEISDVFQIKLLKVLKESMDVQFLVKILDGLDDENFIEIVQDFNLELMTEFLDKVDQNNETIAFNLIEIAVLLKDNPDIQELILNNVLNKFNLQTAQVKQFNLLFHPFQSLIFDACMNNIAKHPIFISLLEDLVLKTQIEIDEACINTILNYAVEEKLEVFSLLRAFYKRTTFQLKHEQIEILFSDLEQDKVVQFLNDLLVERGIEIFKSDITQIFNEIEVKNEAFIKLVYNYIIGYNVFNKNIVSTLRATPSMAPSAEQIKSILLKVPENYKVVQWPLNYFNHLWNLLPLDNLVDKLLFKILTSVQSNIIKDMIIDLVNLIMEFNSNEIRPYLSLLLSAVKKIESSVNLKDIGIAQHYCLGDIPESDGNNEFHFTYTEKFSVKTYSIPNVNELLKIAALKLNSTADSLTLRDNYNHPLSNNKPPPKGQTNFIITGNITPINYNEYPSCTLSELDFSSHLLTLFAGELDEETSKVIQEFLEYLPTNPQIQELVYMPDELIEALKSQENPIPYRYMIKATLRRRKSTEIIDLFKNSSIFQAIKNDFITNRFNGTENYYLLEFMNHFFNDNAVPEPTFIKLLLNILQCQNDEYNKSKKVIIHLLNRYISNNDHKIIIRQILTENEYVESLIQNCKDGIWDQFKLFLTQCLDHSLFYNLFTKYPDNYRNVELLLMILNSLVQSDKKEEIINLSIELLPNFDINISSKILDIILNDNVVNEENVNRIFDLAILIPKDDIRDQILNKLFAFVKNEESPKHCCLMRFFDILSKTRYSGNKRKYGQQERYHKEYVKQQLLHLKVFRNSVFEQNSENKEIVKLQKYFAKNMLNGQEVPFKYVDSNKMSPYKHLTKIMNGLPKEFVDQNFTFVTSQCLLDPSVLENIDQINPYIVVHLTQYSPCDLPTELKVLDQNYRLTGIITKQKSDTKIYRSIVFEGNTWLIYHDQFLNRADETNLLPIFQGVMQNIFSMAPYILFYTRENDINNFQINFNESAYISCQLLHFDSSKIPKTVIKNLEKAADLKLLSKNALSHTICSFIESNATSKQLFFFYLNMYSRCPNVSFSLKFERRLMNEEIPDINDILNNLDIICDCYRKVTAIDCINTISTLLHNVVINYSYDSVKHLIKNLVETFPEITWFRAQSQMCRVILSFLLNHQNEAEQFCRSLNIQKMLIDTLKSNYSNNRPLNYVNSIDGSTIMHCLSYFIDDNLRILLDLIAQLMATKLHEVYFTILMLKCVKNQIFTYDEIMNRLINRDSFSRVKIQKILCDGLKRLSSDTEVSEIASLFESNKELLSFIEHIFIEIEHDRRLQDSLISTGSLFFVRLLNPSLFSKTVSDKVYEVINRLLVVSKTEDFTDFALKFTMYFDSTNSLNIIKLLVDKFLVERPKLARSLISRVDLIKNDIEMTNTYFELLNMFKENEISQLIPLLIPYICNAKDLRFFKKFINHDILSLDAWDSILSKIEKCDDFNDYYILEEFIEAVLNVDKRSSLAYSIVFSKQRNFIPGCFIRFLFLINPDQKVDINMLINSLNFAIESANKNENELQYVDYFLTRSLNYFKNINLPQHKVNESNNQANNELCDETGDGSNENGEVMLNIPEFCEFTLKYANSATSDKLVQLVKVVYQQNPIFKELIEDEIETQIHRDIECPNLVALKMQLEKDTIKIGKIVELHNEAVNKVADATKTSEFLFDFYLSQQYEKTELAPLLFHTSQLVSKSEKAFFSKSFLNMNKTDFTLFLKKFSRTMNPLNSTPIDMKRCWFLIKTVHDFKEMIIRSIPLDRRRIIMIAEMSEPFRKYAVKVFDIKNEEMKIIVPSSKNENPNNDRNGDQNNSEQMEYQKNDDQVSIPREAKSMPILNNKTRNSSNNSPNKNTENTKPYFFRRPDPKK
ncbi:hypothetical protein TRFO_11648 [Tritrichomonas foetus]|uniref:Uncharacterized protein n=1 Tax=Tritrichomonas foetus TaxID=1144522 RepID=A0A1J4J4K1_9EUKA|nr:hypothetical protein TRFO_11648 [Tritrichomonas foetus]|eukprot:OHS93649.1 hypothetical protein TRFO_11648 [Tritrichomonas foetus]